MPNSKPFAALHALLWPRIMPLLLPLLVFMAGANAAFTSPDCPDLKPGEFRYSKLVTHGLDTTLSEPVKLALDLRDSNKVDIYFAERHGKVKRWNAATNTVTVLASLDVWTDSPDKVDSTGDTENGLEAIALDPDFKVNRRIYLRYEPWAKETYRISRMELKGDVLDLASEKILLDIPYVREHTRKQPIVLGGSGMIFDARGDLYIAIGANSELSPSVNEKYRDFSAEYTSSNLASLRGAILRIHPDDSPRGYSIPKGNFGEYYSRYFKDRGRDSLAADYADTSRVKAEIYVKGVRNPYSLNVDPLRGWLVWGEFGPNRMGVARIEEDNLATHPVFAGYPYWSGKNVPLLDEVKPWSQMGLDPKAPVNNSIWNQGPKDLPPADTPRYAYSAYLYNGFIVGNHPGTGPIYRYDAASPSTLKLPPHFEGAWFVTDRMNGVRAFQLDATGTLLLDSMGLMTNQKLERPLDLKQGPDGALYVVDYGPGWHTTSLTAHIGRIEYTGSCHPVNPTVALGSRPSRTSAGQAGIRLLGRSLRVDEAGPHRVRVFDFGGREILTLRGEGPMSHVLSAGVLSAGGQGEPGERGGKGVYFVRVELVEAAYTLVLADL